MAAGVHGGVVFALDCFDMCDIIDPAVRLLVVHATSSWSVTESQWQS